MKHSKLFCLTTGIFIHLVTYSQETSTNNNQVLSENNREHHLKMADDYRQAARYDLAIIQLDSVLCNKQSDAPILLMKGDIQLQDKRFDDAVKTYSKILSLNYNLTTVRINLSYALFMSGRPVKALQYASMAWENDNTNIPAIINYFNAMLWNGKTNEASEFLKSEYHVLDSSNRYVMLARLHTSSGNYKLGLVYYDSLVNKYGNNKFFIQEYAEVLLSKKMFLESKYLMQEHKNLFSDNEYQQYRNSYQLAQIQYAGLETRYFKDIADNIRIDHTLSWQQRPGTRFSFGLAIGKAILTSPSNNKIHINSASVKISQNWNTSFSGQTEIYWQSVNPSSGRNFTNISGKQNFQYQPNDRTMLSLSYQRDVLNYTASLFLKQIASNTIGYSTHLMLSAKTGVYSQGGWSNYSDKNVRLQNFTSIYHIFNNTPLFKAGYNVSLLHYNYTHESLYFSPDFYTNHEIFIDFKSNISKIKGGYVQLQPAAGFQKVNNMNWQPTYRFQADAGYSYKNAEISFKYQMSNVASSNGTGYRYNAYSLRFAWKW